MTNLPFAPLAHNELNERARIAREQCGYRTITVIRYAAGEFEPRDLDFLREHGEIAIAYQDAAMARCQR